MANESSRNNNYIQEKQNALADCCNKNKIDLLVNVSYEIKHEAGKIQVCISGFPAKFKRIRPATKDDLWMLQFIETNNTNN